MVAKNVSKQEALRNRVYKFFEENKNFTFFTFDCLESPQEYFLCYLKSPRRFSCTKEAREWCNNSENDPKASQQAQKGLQP